MDGKRPWSDVQAIADARALKRAEGRYREAWREAEALAPDLDGGSRAADAALSRARRALTAAGLSDVERCTRILNAIEREDPPQGALDHIQLDPDSPATREGVRRFGRLVSPDLIRQQPRIVAAPPSNRGWAMRTSATTSKVSIRSSGAVVENVVHELGHTIEFGSDDLFREAAAFLRRQNERVIGARTGVLSETEYTSYATGIGRWDAPDPPGSVEAWDAYQDRYAGRRYTGDGVRTLDAAGVRVPLTEIVSIGLERLADDPLAFARRDWEYFSFILRRVTWR